MVQFTVTPSNAGALVRKDVVEAAFNGVVLLPTASRETVSLTVELVLDAAVEILRTPDFEMNFKADVAEVLAVTSVQITIISVESNHGDSESSRVQFRVAPNIADVLVTKTAVEAAFSGVVALKSLTGGVSTTSDSVWATGALQHVMDTSVQCGSSEHGTIRRDSACEHCGGECRECASPDCNFDADAGTCAKGVGDPSVCLAEGESQTCNICHENCERAACGQCMEACGMPAPPDPSDPSGVPPMPSSEEMEEMRPCMEACCECESCHFSCDMGKECEGNEAQDGRCASGVGRSRCAGDVDGETCGSLLIS